MSNLCGAWALSGGPIEKHLTESDKNAMLAQEPDGPQGVCQFSGGSLWMAAGAGNMAHDGRACMAVEGYIAFEENGPQNLEELFKWQKSRPSFEVFPNGHYALVHADTAKNVLVLLRDISGGEQLFYVRSGDLLLFSVSARPLLAHSLVPRTIDPETATEFLLNGAILFGSRTLFSGIEQVLPGHLLEASRDGIKQCRHWKQMLEPPEENPIDTPHKLRQALIKATKLAIGKDRQAAVGLSGGVDSSVIAACAVELLGPKNVHAFTYEFQDTSHPSEAPYAMQFCRHLGIRHHTVKITRQDYLDAVPETLWRMENPRSVPHATRVQIFAKKVVEKGFARVLAGYAMEYVLGLSYSGYCDSAARILPGVPRPDWTLRFWKLAVSPPKHWHILARFLAGKIHPGLIPPPPDLYYFILCALQHNEIMRDVSVFYPPGLREMVRGTIMSPHVSGAIREIRDLPLSVQLQYLNGHRMLMVQLRTIPLARTTGASHISPAALLSPACFSMHVWRHPRPGRILLREAMKDCVPEAIFHRPQDLTLAVISKLWMSEIARGLECVAAQSRDYLKARYFKEFDSVRKCFDENSAVMGIPYEPFGIRNMNLLALWHRAHIELPLRTTPPDWDALKAAGDRRSACAEGQPSAGKLR
ncbi:MAG: asparagine synthase-related protein [bacterium]